MPPSASFFAPGQKPIEPTLGRTACAHELQASYSNERRRNLKNAPYPMLLDINIWVAVTVLKLSYHNPETILFTMYPHCGDSIFQFLNSNPARMIIAVSPEPRARKSNEVASTNSKEGVHERTLCSSIPQNTRKCQVDDESRYLYYISVKVIMVVLGLVMAICMAATRALTKHQNVIKQQ